MIGKSTAIPTWSWKWLQYTLIRKKKKNHVWVPDLVQRQAGWKEVVNPEKKNLSDPLLENLFLILITTKQFLSPWKYIK